MEGRRRGVLLFAVAALAAVGSAQGAKPPAGSPAVAPVAFEDKKIITSCGRLAKGVPVVVANRTIERLPIYIRFGLFRDESKALRNARSICGGLTIVVRNESTPAHVAAGSTRKITLRAVTVPTSGEQVYTGTIAVFSKSGTASRIPITIAAQESDAVALKPLVESVSATDYRGIIDVQFDWPPVSRASKADDYVTVWVPVEKVADDKPVALEDDTVIGAVAGGDNRFADVTYVRKADAGAITKVGLYAGGLSPGKYDGTVDLDDDDEGGEVSLALTVKDPWWCAAGAILLGLGVAALVQFLLGAFLPRRRLRHEIDDLGSERLAAAERKFKAVDGNPWPNATFTAVDEMEELRQKIKDKTRGAVLLIDPKVIDALRADIDSVRARIDGLPTLANKLVALEKLLSTQPADADMPERHRDDLDEPEPLLARELSKPTPPPNPLKVSEVEKLMSELDGALTAIAQLVAMELRIASLVHDWRTLERELPDSDPRRKALPDLKKRLDDVWHQVWNARTADQLSDYRDEISIIDNGITALWWLPEDDAYAQRANPEQFASGLADARAAFEAAEVGDSFLITESDDVLYAFRPRERIREILEASRPLRAYGLTVALEVLAVGLALALALLAGMTALYVDKPFGSRWDYVIAITWGVVTPTAIATLAGALNKLGETGAFRRLVRSA